MLWISGLVGSRGWQVVPPLDARVKPLQKCSASTQYVVEDRITVRRL